VSDGLGLVSVSWKHAALRLGEELASVGPDGYYQFTSDEWLRWALAAVRERTAGKDRPFTQELLDLMTLMPDTQTQSIIEYIGKLREARLVRDQALSASTLPSPPAHLPPLPPVAD
jgi:hypothetical protein